MNAQPAACFHCGELCSSCSMETRGVRGGNSPAAFASSTCVTPVTSRSAADGYSWLFSPKGTPAPGFPSSLRGQQRASSAQSLPAPEPLEAALPPPQSLLLLIHPQVLHVKPQPAPGCFQEYFSQFPFIPVCPNSLPLLTFHFPPPALQGTRKKDFYKSKRLERPQKSCGFLEQQEVD